MVSPINLYAGLVAGPWGSQRPQVEPVRISLDTASLGARPGSVKAIGADGVRWKFADGLLQIDIGRLAHHAVLVLT